MRLNRFSPAAVAGRDELWPATAPLTAEAPDPVPPLVMQQRGSTQVDVLSDILADDVNLVIWQRPLSAELQNYARQWPAQRRLQRVLSLQQLSAHLTFLLPEVAGQAAMQADIMLAAEMLGCLMATDTIGIRLAPQSGPQCPNWHTDHVMLRLLISYGLAGTEYLAVPPDSQGLADSNAQLIGCQQLALLKGSAWSGHQRQAIWHRSASEPSMPSGCQHGAGQAALAKSIQSRLLLTLDPL